MRYPVLWYNKVKLVSGETASDKFHEKKVDHLNWPTIAESRCNLPIGLLNCIDWTHILYQYCFQRATGSRYMAGYTFDCYRQFLFWCIELLETSNSNPVSKFPSLTSLLNNVRQSLKFVKTQNATEFKLKWSKLNAYLWNLYDNLL